MRIDSTPEIIFSVYEKVEKWPQWDADVERASLEVAFVAGTKGKLKSRKGPLVEMHLTEVEKNRSFTDEPALPSCRMRFEHHLVIEGRATRVIHRVSFSGPLAFFFGRVIGSQLSRGLPEALRMLKAQCESGIGSSP